MTNALSAAVTLTASDFIDNGMEKGESRNYKVLQSLDMRRFGEQLDNCETVACMAGSMDLLHGPLPDKSGQALRDNPSAENLYQFWKLALEGKEQTAAFIESDGPRHAVRVFDFAMSISDMNNLIHLTAQSKDSQGRAYSAGISNVGVYDRQKAVRRRDDTEREPLQVSLAVVQKRHRNALCTQTVSIQSSCRFLMEGTRLKKYFLQHLMLVQDVYTKCLV
jgi:hypothetical protein